MRLFLLLGALLSPLIIGSFIIDTSAPATAIPEIEQPRKSTNITDLRTETKQAIDNLVDNGNLSTDYYTKSVEPVEHNTLTINTCYNKIGHANFRLEPTMISQQDDPGIHSVITNGTNVISTGNIAGNWIEIINGELTGYIHKCWTNN